MASAPTFLVNMESTAVEPAMTGTWVAEVFSRESTGCSSCSMTPERATAALITRALAMITTTSLVKPLKTRLTGTTPTLTPASRAISATTS